VKRLPQRPLLVVVTHRPEFKPDFEADGHVTHLALARLSAVQSSAVVSRIVQGEAMPASLIDRIVARTDGVPLFIEELTKVVLESASWRDAEIERRDPNSLDRIAIPATLRDSLMARLDRSPVGKVIAQVGAAIGRDFSYEILSAVAPVPAAELDRALGDLVAAGLMYARETQGGLVYSFKHALVQDVASDSLLKRPRADLHASIARVLEERFPETVQAHPELLAHHYTAAGLTEKAIAFWKLAGRHAVVRSANLEAENHLREALRLLDACPPSFERKREELEVYTMLANVLVATKGYASNAVDDIYACAHALSLELGDMAQLFGVLRGQTQSTLLQAQYALARQRSEHLLALAERDGDPPHRLAAAVSLGVIDLFVGDFLEAHRRLEQCTALPQSEERRVFAISHGIDISIVTLAYYARNLWFLGYPERALKHAREALSLAQAGSTSLSMAQAMGMLAVVHQARRDLQATQEWADKTIEYSIEYSNVFWEALAVMLQGWLRAQRGEAQVGVAQISRGLAAYEATGARLGRSSFLLLLAEAHQHGGESKLGMQVLEHALAHVEETGEQYHVAEIHRRKGELLLESAPDQPSAAEACFVQALDVARAQHAKSWELRAVTSLARLYLGRGDKARARGLLAPLCDWFTEGHDTADLQEARRVLEAEPSPSRKLPRVVDQRVYGRRGQGAAFGLAFGVLCDRVEMHFGFGQPACERVRQCAQLLFRRVVFAEDARDPGSRIARAAGSVRIPSRKSSSPPPPSAWAPLTSPTSSHP
jgi:tetratricopeptide (TPR) repeat protein